MDIKKEGKILNNYNIKFKKRDYINSTTGTNIYTEGFIENNHHPEIQIVLDFKKEIIEYIIDRCYKKIIKGEFLLTDIIYDDILPNGYKVVFKKKIDKKKVFRLIFADNNNQISKDDIHYDFLKQYK